MFKKTAIILAAMALSVGSAAAVQLDCATSGQLSSGLTLCGGDKLFSGFKVIDSAGVDVTGSIGASTFVEGSTVGITFTTPFNISSGVADWTLQFVVAVTDPNWFITSIGQAVTGAALNPAAFAQIDEAVWSTGFGSGSLLANSTVKWISDPLDPDLDGPEFGDNLVLSTPSQLIYVQKDILLNAGSLRDPLCEQYTCELGASATTITQRFFQTPGDDIPPVPEPTTMLLFSTALLGLGFMRRKKS